MFGLPSDLPGWVLPAVAIAVPVALALQVLISAILLRAAAWMTAGRRVPFGPAAFTCLLALLLNVLIQVPLRCMDAPAAVSIMALLVVQAPIVASVVGSRHEMTYNTALRVVLVQFVLGFGIALAVGGGLYSVAWMVRNR